MDGNTIWWIILGVFCLVICALVADALGQARGFKRSQFWWGLMLGVIGVIVVAVMPRYRADDDEQKDFYIKALRCVEEMFKIEQQELKETQTTLQQMIEMIQQAYHKQGLLDESNEENLKD